MLNFANWLLKTRLFLALLLLSSFSPAKAEISQVVLQSKVLQEDRIINIALPQGYSNEETYPVLIALDGEQFFLTANLGQIHAVNPRLIVVGVQNVDRNRDMFPRPIPSKRKPGGSGELFLDFINQELIPYVEENYQSNGFRVLSGQSNSGFFVIYAMLKTPGAFSGYLASSPMVGWDRDLIHDLSTEVLEGRKSFSKILYFNQGEKDKSQVADFLPAYIELIKEIAPAGFRWKHETIAGSQHVPPSSFKEGLGFIFGG